MAKLRLDKEMVEAAVLGGAVLGGGGGGSMAAGRRNGLLAVELGDPELVEIDDLPAESVLVTASAVGAPAAKTAYSLPVHYLRAVDLLARQGGVRVDGLITNECGGTAAVNGWLQSAALGVPVVDAPCNGRAHPTGVMGSLGLHKVEGYVSQQTAVGGDPAVGRYVEMYARGSLEKAAALVRQAAVQSGGMVAVARNPVGAGYAKEHAAVGAVKQCVAIGRAMAAKQGAGPLAMVEAACQVMGGEVVARGRVGEVNLETKGGFDVGTIVVRAGREVAYLTFWNEYMCLEVGGDSSAPPRRVATFPDLVTTFDLASGLPVSSAEVAVGQEVAVTRVGRQHLILGAGMRDPALMRPIEDTTGKEILKYVFA